MTIAISAALLAVAALGCSGPDGTATQREAEIRACGLQGDPSITSDVDLHACPADATKKTTICHLPPGNPENAHTLCVGNNAVRAHVENHHDTLGPCPAEPPCDGGDVDAGVPGVDASAGSGSNIDGGDVIFWNRRAPIRGRAPAGCRSRRP